MSKAGSEINLFHYMDYRKFLHDLYIESKKTRSPLSFRAFAQRAGFRSINFFKFVMEGKRNLTEESVAKFSKGLHLNKQEQEFFRNLVFFNQATTHEERDRHYQALLRSRKFSQLKPIEKDQYEYYSACYHPAVRELVASKDFDGTPEWIARRLYPSITPQQAERSIKLLEKLGFIEKTPEGHYQQTSTLISTGPEVTSLAIVNYHKNILDLAKQIQDQIPPVKRDISTLTLGVQRERLPQIKKRIQEFRQEIMKLVSMDTPEEVLQVNIQLLPLTQWQDNQSLRGA